MKLGSLKTALLAASILGSTSLAPITAALADTPRTVTNATVAHSASAYDNFDRFKDASGRPLAGWQYLIYAANSNG